MLKIRDISKLIMEGSGEKFSENLRLEVDVLDTRWQHVIKLAYNQNEGLQAALTGSEAFVESLEQTSSWMSEQHSRFVVDKRYSTITERAQFTQYEKDLAVSLTCIYIHVVLTQEVLMITNRRVEGAT